jgi:3-hydroxybutyryl-CoA dehydratase
LDVSFDWVRPQGGRTRPSKRDTCGNESPFRAAALDAAALARQKAASKQRRASMSDGVFFEDLAIGQSASIGKTITEADILMFAAVSMDTNPVHLNAEVAAASQFKERIAHGMLSAGLISAVLGTKLPGPGSIYLGQTLRFRRPVKIGDTVTATCEVTAIDAARKQATLKTTCTVAGKTVIEGEAVVLPPSRG